MNTGEKIKKIRKMAGMTQEEFAEKMNVSRQTVSKWEKNLSSPDLESAILLCRVFQISLDDFLEGSQTIEKEKKISLQDMIKANRRTQRQTILLISSLFFFMIGVLSALFINAMRSTTASIEYILYRYMVTGEYTSAPVDYRSLMIPVIVLLAIGVIPGAAYIAERRKEKKDNEL